MLPDLGGTSGERAMLVRARHRAARHLVRAAVLVAAATAASLTAVPGVAPVSAAIRASAPAAKGARSVAGVRTLTYKPVKVSRQTARNFTPAATRWPVASSVSVALAAPARGAAAGAVARAGSSAAWAQAVAPAAGAWSGPSEVGVVTEPRSLSDKLGIDGVVWQVSGLSAGSGQVRAGLDYGSFAQAYGGNYGLRLQVVELPACALTTPGLARCRRETPLRTRNDARTDEVSALIALPSRGARLDATVTAPATRAAAAAATASSAVVLAAASAGSGTTADGGDAGTYGATSLKPSGSWTEGGASGDFTYTYNVDVLSASSALTPRT
jgi:hypothetical protein